MPSGTHTFPADRFALWPFVAAAALWAVSLIPMIYDIGGLFLDPSLIPALLVLPLGALAWLAFLVLALARLRWRAALSVFCSAVAFLAISVPTLLYSREIRFLTMWPVYSIEVARKSDRLQKLSWLWSAGYGYQETLFYDDTDRYAPPAGQAEYVDDNCQIGTACGVRIRHMGGHFYLSTLHW